MVFRNILWDLDGTLFDTYPAMTNAMSKALLALGAQAPLNLVDGLVRQSLEQAVEALSARYRLEAGELSDAFRQHYRAVPLANQRPYPGVGEVCLAVQHGGGLNAIVTHRGEESSQALLAAHGLEAFFVGIISAAAGYARKPDPVMYLVALSRYELAPHATLAVGDRPLDIQAARAAGLRTCLYGNATLSEPAEFHIRHYGELLPLLAPGPVLGERLITD